MAAAAVFQKTGIRERFVSWNKERMFVREAGEPGTPAILLFHDFSTTSEVFVPLMELLSDRYHLVAPDLVGFGRSGRPSEAEFGYTFGRLGCYAGTIMTEDLGIERYAVYAQGSSGPVALGAFNEVKSEISAMIMQSAAWSLDPFERLVAAKAEGAPTSEAVSRLLGFFRSKSWYFKDVWSHAIRSYELDVLVLQGERDDVIGGAEEGEMPATLPHAKTVIFDAGHDVLTERTSEIASEIHAFLSKLEP